MIWLSIFGSPSYFDCITIFCRSLWCSKIFNFRRFGNFKANFSQRSKWNFRNCSRSSRWSKIHSFCRKKEATDYLHDLADRIEDPDRILPGNFVYLSDILGSPQDLRQIGQLIATKYAYSNIDYVMTIETKGIAIAQAVSRFLNVPFVMVRRRPKITEGSTISVNYVASSSERVEKMELAKRLLPEGSNVLIVDDFMKGGGTLTGMEELVKEFKGTVAGMCVLCETKYASQKVVDDYQSLIKITEVDRDKKLIKVRPGNFLEQTDFNRFPK